MSVPPGWYPDPSPYAHTGERWWDGYTWTGHTRPFGPPPPTGPTTDDGVPLAGFWWRALALLIDGVATSALALLVTLPVQIEIQRELFDLQRDFQRDVDAGGTVDFGGFFADNLAVYADHWLGLFVLPVLLGVAYHASFLRWKAATPGKLACGLRVRRPDQAGPPPWPAIATRVGVQTVVPAAGYTLAVLSGSPAAAGLAWLALMAYALTDYLWAAGSRRRAVHDLVAGTVVVRPPR